MNRETRQVLSCTLLALLLGSLSSEGFALDFVVDDDFDGVDPLTACLQIAGASYFPTYGPAIAAANVGGGPHTVHVCAGLAYVGGGALTNPNYDGVIIQGTTGNASDVRITALGGQEVFDLRRPGIVLQHLTAIGTTNDGIEVRANNVRINNVVVNGPARRGVFYSNADNGIITNVSVNGSGQEGIFIQSNSTGVTLTNITVSGATDCIEVDGDDALAANLNVSNCTDEGLDLDSADMTLNNANVGPGIGDVGVLINDPRNIITSLTVTGAPNDDGVLVGGGGDNASFTDLVVSNVGSEGLRTVTGAGGVSVTNAMVTNAGSECIQLQGPNATLTNLTVSQCGNDGVALSGANSTLSTANIGPAIGDIGLYITRSGVIGNDITVVGAAIDGVQLSGGADNVTIDNLSITNSGDEGIQILNGANVVNITNLTLDGAGDQCIQTGSGATFVLVDATISNCGDGGVQLRGNDHTLTRVSITDTGQHGLLITRDRAQLTDVTVVNGGAAGTGFDGIITTRGQITMTRTTVRNPGDFGIYINASGTNRTDVVLREVVIENTQDDALFVNRITAGLVVDDLQIQNSADRCITLNRVRNGQLSNLDVQNCGTFGVLFSNTRFTSLSQSNISDTNRGIQLQSNSRDNIIRENFIENHRQRGLLIANAGTNFRNLVFRNCFTNPLAGATNASDAETAAASNTFFDIATSQGNYWGNENGGLGFSQTCADADFNGVCDVPYLIPGAGASTDDFAFKSCPLAPLVAYYPMDEPFWNGTAGEVLDLSGNANNGISRGGADTDDVIPAVPGNPGTCGYGFIPDNNTVAPSAGVDTGLDVDSVLGDVVSISFWYNVNGSWADLQWRALFDATPSGTTNWFMLLRRFNSLLLLVRTADGFRFVFPTGLTLAAGDWHYITATMDLGASRLRLYVDGVQIGQTLGVSTTVFDVETLFIGDFVGGNAGLNASADGLIDELRIYRRELTQPEIAADMALTHPCPDQLDHFSIAHAGTAVNCQAEPITFSAHRNDHSVLTSYSSTISLSTTTGNGDWSLSPSASGVLSNGGGGSGTYTFAAADNGQAILLLKDTVTETTNINVDDTGTSEQSGSAQPGEDPDLQFAEAGFNFLADGVPGAIGSQIAGKPSNVGVGAQLIELQAIRTSDQTGACEAALVGPNDIELAFECVNPIVCANPISNPVTINGMPIAGNSLASVVAYSPVSLDFGNAADTTADTVVTYFDAGQIRLHARFDIPDGGGLPSGNLMVGASNPSAVRPFGYFIDIPGNAAAVDDSGGIFTEAAEPFSVSVTAIGWDASDDVNLDGIPDGHELLEIDPSTNPDNLANNFVLPNFGQEVITQNVALTGLLDQPAGGNDPGLAGTSVLGSFVAGSGGANDIRYDEVGIIEITALDQDGDYLGAGPVISKSSFVGRFTPFDLAVSPSATAPEFASSCGTFTYVGQLFNYSVVPVFDVTARNKLGVTTQNYTGLFFKLTPSSLTFPVATDNGYLSFSGTLDTTQITSPKPLVADLGNGLARLTFDSLLGLRFDRGPPAIPFDAEISLGINVIDEDSISFLTNPAQVGVAAAGGGIAFDNGNEMRWGRIALENAFGSELSPVALGVRAEHFVNDGANNGFIVNAADNCSSYDATNLSFSNRVGLTVDPLASGAGSLISGRHDPANPLLLDSNGALGSVDATLGVDIWLQFDWDNDTVHDNDPTGRVTFGIFSGRDPLIYIRENWN